MSLQGKMAKFEDKMEKWEKERESFQETVLSILEHRKDEMQSVIYAQNTNLKNLQKEYKDFRDQITNITQQISGTHDIADVAFNAYTSTSVRYSGSQTIQFPNVLLNEGGGYSSDTGYFTAPVSGLYHFNAHICNYNGEYVMAALFHRNTKIALTTEFANDGWSCSSVSAPVKLNSGEQVCIKSMGNKQLHADTDNRWPSFNGFLVHL